MEDERVGAIESVGVLLAALPEVEIHARTAMLGHPVFLRIPSRRGAILRMIDARKIGLRWG